MFSRPRRSAGIWILVVAFVALPGCGRKGDPQPPPRKHPAQTRDLTVEQSGMELVVSMSYPTMTEGGLALAGIDAVELFRHVRPAPEFLPQPELTEPFTDEDVEVEAAPGEVEVESLEPTETAEIVPGEETPEDAEAASEEGAFELPPPNPFASIRVDFDAFDEEAETVLTLEGDSLQAAVLGGRVVMRLPLGTVATEPPEAHHFAIRTRAGRLRSERSSIASFVPLAPPATPTGLRAEPRPGGITLTWAPLTDESEIGGYRVLRRSPQEAGFGPALATTQPGVTTLVDGSARFGQRYVYAVTASRMQTPLLESAPGTAVEIDYRDTFAPAAPERLVALAESGRIRLLWDAVADNDLTGYLVFVSTDGGAPQPLTPEPIVATEFVHDGTLSGTPYVYTVLAVDSAGNRSESSNEAATRAP